MRDGLVKTVSHLLPAAMVAGYESISDLLRQMHGSPPHLVVLEMNLRLADCSLSGLEGLRKRLPQAEILALSPLSERQFGLAVLRAGASTFLPLSVSLEEFGKAISALLAGDGYISTEMAAVVADEAQGRGPRNGFSKLSPRELDVVRHLIWGMQLKTVASTLGLNIRTASCYKKNALGKLGMNPVAEVVRYSSELGFTV
ncbi:MAG: two component transcriptional regulator, LuxR family [Verrucomicrobiaceae bacterium]|nr:two component transcriptional regulator, LuxR family [Verrucomicrobiaceae bacterium]